eukprot:TRINITY_DN372_c2_g1_i2.p1 TRINITY_DN372_c2_g1~~TRINITY_DN372_c2_g1_i2.p1  ORF type:complete len:1560 (+),score=412.28 TRINITY_DN372_c2_g1_i2:118-4797(+)
MSKKPEKEKVSSQTSESTCAERELEEEEEEEDEEIEEEEEDTFESVPKRRKKMSGGDQAELQGHLQLMKQVGELGFLLPGMGMGGSQRVTAIVNNLVSGSEEEKMMALTDLCEMLSISTEETLLGFRTDQVIPSLVKCMQMEENQEIMLLSCRALYHLMEALPGSIPSIVAAGSVAVFVEKLLSIQIIDLAEQALLCLEKVSVEAPVAVLKEGGMGAMLMFIDFFSISLQRKIILSISNMAKRVSQTHFTFVEDCLPQLSQLLVYEDPQLVEGTASIFYKLLLNFQGDEARIVKICSETTVQNLLTILKRDREWVTTSTWPTVIKSLIILVRWSIPMSFMVMRHGVISCLLMLLKMQSECSGLGVEATPATSSNSPGIMSPATKSGKGMSAETVGEAVELLETLLPTINDGLLSEMKWPSKTGIGREESGVSNVSLGTRGPSGLMIEKEDAEEEEEEEEEEDSMQPSLPRPDTNADEASNQGRITLFTSNSEFMRDMANGLPDLIDVYSNTVHRYSKHRSISVIAAVLHYAPADLLKDSLSSLPISSFIAHIIHSGELVAVTTGVHVAQVLIDKLPDIFSVYFVREGVVMEVGALAQTDGVSDRLPPPVMDPKDGAPPNHMQRVRDAAATLLKKHFSSDRGVLKSLEELQKIAAKLETWTKCSSSDHMLILQELAALLVSSEGVSTYEFVKSGVVPALRSYLTQNDAEQDTRLRRAHTFLRAFAVQEGEHPSYLSILMKKLVASLHQTERLPIYVTEHGGGPSAGWSSSLKLLAHPFRLMLVPDNPKNEKSNTTVMIEPLATVGAVEDFIQCKLGVREESDEEGRLFSLHPHPLMSASHRPAGWRCNQCSASFRGPGQPRWRCFPCDYDLCENCATEHQVDSESKKKEKEKEKEKEKKRKSGLLWPLRRDKKKEAKKEETASASPSTGEEESEQAEEKAEVSISLNGVQLAPSLSIFKAIHMHSDWREKVDTANSSEMIHTTRAMWGKVYTLKYKFSKPGNSQVETSESPTSKNEVINLNKSLDRVCEGCSTYLQACDYTLSVASEYKTVLDDSTTDVLYTMNALCALNQSAYNIMRVMNDKAALSLAADTDLRSNKLTNKVLRQVLDGLLLCTGHPNNSWCRPLLVDCRFLFSFNTRMTFFELASFGPSRSMLRLQEILEKQGEECKYKLGRVHKQKIKLARDTVMESAVKVMDMYGSQKAFLEFEYFDEVGTGLGPTMEFYTLVSRALQKDTAGMWLKQEEGTTGFGLFPRPMAQDDPARDEILKMSKFVGQFLARALYDTRVVDLPLASPLLKILRGDPLCYGDLHALSPTLGDTVSAFLTLAAERDAIITRHSGKTPEAVKEIETTVLFNKVPIADLALDFTLSGYPAVEMVPGGAKREVTVWNMDEYAGLTCEWFLKKGIQDQVMAMGNGANQVFPFTQLRYFSVSELDLMLCGSGEPLTVQTLEAATVCDHGYTANSRAVQMLFAVLEGFNAVECRQFISFVTGAPRLPVGGLKALKPNLTIVRKTGEDTDKVLPSVMTCQNYLKLPDYSTPAIMEAKLRQAMTEGADAFHLS